MWPFRIYPPPSEFTHHLQNSRTTFRIDPPPSEKIGFGATGPCWTFFDIFWFLFMVLSYLFIDLWLISLIYYDWSRSAAPRGAGFEPPTLWLRDPRAKPLSYPRHTKFPPVLKIPSGTKKQNPKICPNMSQYVPICPNMSQYAPICPNIPQYTPIYPNISQYFPIFPNISQYIPIYPNIP